MTLSYRQRLAVLAAVAGCVMAAILGRLFVLQVVDHRQWVATAEEHTIARRPIRGARGPILDADGEVLAHEGRAFDLVFYPAAWAGRRYECTHCGLTRWYQVQLGPGERCPRCKSKETLGFADDRDVSRVAALLELSSRELLDRIRRRIDALQRSIDMDTELKRLTGNPLARRRRTLWLDRGWREATLARDISYELVREVTLHPRRNPAFRIRTVQGRRLPGGRPFVHILGVEPREGSPGNGLEGLYDPYLRGEPGWIETERDPRRRGPGHETARREPLAGVTLQLTIRSKDQRAAAGVLRGAEGALVVVEAATGAVLVLATAPGYEPDRLREVLQQWSRRKDTERSPLIDRAVNGFHIPGSILKPFTAVAALFSGVSRASDSIACNRYFTYHGRTFRDQLRCHKAHGPLDLHRALVKSCNIYFQTQMGRIIDAQLLSRYIEVGRSFGFGLPTGIEIEWRRTIARRTFRFKSSHRAGDFLGASIGQGPVLLTPAQLARAYAALATGRLPTLHLLRRLGNRPTQHVARPLPVGPGILEPIRAALRRVAGPEGTAAGTNLLRWRMGLKTGTAQKRRGKSRVPLHNAWMAGFADAQAGRPAIAFAMVVLNTPDSGAAACGRRLFEFFRVFYERKP